MPLTPTTAQAFADRWYSAWNAGSIDAIMACYDDQVEHSSPFIARFNGTSDPTLRGIANVRAYFQRALDRDPTPPGVIRFNPLYRTTGHESVVLVYRRMSGEVAAEIFFLSPTQQILRSISHYG